MNKLDKRMRDVESKYDRQASPGNFLVARVDGRGFSRLTEEMAYEKPFDDRFREIMTGTARHLMSTGFEISYAILKVMRYRCFLMLLTRHSRIGIEN